MKPTHLACSQSELLADNNTGKSIPTSIEKTGEMVASDCSIPDTFSFCLWNNWEEEMVPFAKVEGLCDSDVDILYVVFQQLVEDHLTLVSFDGGHDKPRSQATTGIATVRDGWDIKIYRFPQREMLVEKQRD